MILRMAKRKKKHAPADSFAKLINQPWGWWQVFVEQSERDGAKSLAEWIGAKCRGALDKDLEEKLEPKERPTWGKDKQAEGASS